MDILAATRKFAGKNTNLFTIKPMPIILICRAWRKFLAARSQQIDFPVVLARPVIREILGKKAEEYKTPGYFLISGRWRKVPVERK
jgi:hypothetical protein